VGGRHLDKNMAIAMDMSSEFVARKGEPAGLSRKSVLVAF